jgi:AcrR family transcriptional regulator
MASSAPDRLSARATEIVGVARQQLEQEGLEGLTMRRLADRLGIRAPSLYKHFADKQVLEAALISDGFAELADVFERATAGADDPLHAIAVAYRAFAHAHPHLYRLMTERPLHRDKLVPGVEDRAALPLYQAVGEDIDLARAAWAFAHGMTNLELNGRFPPDADLDAAWERGLTAISNAHSEA